MYYCLALYLTGIFNSIKFYKYNIKEDRASQVIAINFQTVAAANNYWKNK
ncbi:MAG: hypothetical protein GX957_02330 [Clostridiaceae bacterium]|nr:hypothetical protein [Clostridiaceae bacterium]